MNALSVCWPWKANQSILAFKRGRLQSSKAPRRNSARSISTYITNILYSIILIEEERGIVPVSNSWLLRRTLSLWTTTLSPLERITSSRMLTIRATTPNAAFAVPCTFNSTRTKPGGGTYPVVPGACHPGDLARNAVVGPDFLNTDFSVTKNTKITEKLNIQLRSEFFDIFNHPNFGNPVLTATSGSFGQIQSTPFPTGDFGSARQIQFALKLLC
jgi:hypothetical protein